MKKVICLFTVIAMLLTSTMPSFAIENVEKSVSIQRETFSEITEIEDMRDISVQIPLMDEDGKATYCLYDEETGLATERYEVNQLLEREVTRSGGANESYAKTTIDIVYVANSGDQSQSRSGWDSTGSVRFYTTLYYSTQSGPYNYTYYDMDSITGGFQKADSSITIVSQNLVYGQIGYGTDHINHLNQSTSSPIGGTISGWTRWPVGTWVPVSFSLGNGNMGCTLNYTLRRNSGTWNGKLLNNILNET